MEVLPTIFVLDTNIPLHDPFCLTKFKEHDIELHIKVIEELDNFKNGLDTIHFNAREFLRILNDLSEGKIFNGGVSLGEGLGKLRIALNKNLNKRIKANLTPSVDTDIINLAFCLQQENIGKKNIVLVSKDVNLRLKAQALGIKAEDFLNDSVKNLGSLTSNVGNLEVTNLVMDTLYTNNKISTNEKNLYSNQNLILKSSQNKTAIVKYKEGFLFNINKKKLNIFGIKPRNTEQAFAMDALSDDGISLVTIEGKAGTGKTLLAIASALCKLKNGIYDEILFSRQTISMGDREIGFLPGDINDKIGPFMNGFNDNLTILKNLDTENFNFIHNNSEKITIEPLAYIRGRSLHKVFFILDESQNLTPHEIKTIVTRAGEKSKFVFLGDVHQIDNPYLDQRSNGFSYLMNKFKNQKMYSHINLFNSERSDLAELAGNLL